MNVLERTIIFEVGDEPLVGVFACPEDPKPIAVLIVVGGPQYRIGSHRQFVLLARKLAEQGFPVLRFDYRGMGDSAGAQRDFEHIEDDIHGAIGAIAKSFPATDSIVLWGLCDGASAAMIFSGADPRIKGMVLLNPWVRSEATLARTYLRHYYVSRLFEASLWRKIFSGAFSPRWAARALIQNMIRATVKGRARDGDHSPQAFQSRMIEGIVKFPGKILFILSGHDLTAKEFTEWIGAHSAWKRALTNNPRISMERLATADHTFSSAESRSVVEHLTASWISRSFEPQLVGDRAGDSALAIKSRCHDLIERSSQEIAEWNK
ncbi:MAG: hydrolase 1, exosortase A system-associated [Burkholderiales bacterium]